MLDPANDEDPPSPSREGDALKDGVGIDFFASLGTEHKRRGDSRADRPDPSKIVHSTELNKQLLAGKGIDEYEVKEEKKAAPGGAGWQWRMMKLKRLYEQAEEQ